MIKENFVAYIADSIKKNWDYPALSDYKGKDFTYADTGRQIKWLHKLFEEAGIKKGDKIALLGKNSAHWGMVYLATVSYGGVIVPILPDFHANDIHHIVNHSDSKLLFVGEMLWEQIDESCMENLHGILSIEDFSALCNKPDCNLTNAIKTTNDFFNQKYKNGFSNEDFEIAPVSNDEIGIINYTSGTTGFSKGVVLKNNALAANVRFARNNLPLNAGEKIVSILPLAHTYGCAFEFLWPFSMGCHINFLTRTPSPKIIVQAFQSIKPSVVIAVPLIIEKIYKKQIKPALDKKLLKLLTSLPLVDKPIYQKINKKLTDVFGGEFREIVIGGAPLSEDVETFLRKIKFRYTIGYGMTECGPLISYSGWQKTKYRSAGQVVDTLDIKIDANEDKKEVGEILVRGENIMEGYYKNPEATAKAIDKDGWLHTGDLGMVDDEGFVFINGRSKSLILGPSGENIYPEEIESKINNLPHVMESLVLPDDNKLVALVYPDYEAIDKEGIRVNQLPGILEEGRSDINSELPKFKQISHFKLYPREFEKTPKKSIKRFLYEIED
ncbi:Long-chain-fatty-acid--CoA ligase FadD15 [Salinivirga cyanobacteriivorans]|uniref:Long-chain-fatty-acid--CoA ligase FadD15 n=1 Tax=Salinivirga cyanobacteriivorans TaxID=1307839 RepID=A0A0S2I555_9BACT|nr:Long-chain-fatty-acid--CoA ligase FadD15 [Salinivirga cyanobacteriivorans]